MIFSEVQLDAIDRLIERIYNKVLARTLGRDALSKEEFEKLVSSEGLEDIINPLDYIRIAYLVGKMRGTTGEPVRRITLDEFRRQVLGETPALSAQDILAIEHLKKNLGSYIEGLRDETKKNIKGILRNANYEARINNINEFVRPAIERIIKEGGLINEAVKDVEQSTGDSYTDWKKILTTELNSAHNQASVNAIAERNRGKKNDDILVYCIGPLDSDTCPECVKYYHNGSSYKIYRLSELKANGSNYGTKRNAWKAIVPPMHPMCRHRIVELPQGFSLDDNGFTYYIGPEHHEKDNNLAKAMPQIKMPGVPGIKARGYPVGTVREWKGIKYIKQASGHWIPYTTGKHPKAEGSTEALPTGKKEAPSHIAQQLEADHHVQHEYSRLATEQPINHGKEVSVHQDLLHEALTNGHYALISGWKNDQHPDDKDLTDEQFKERHEKLGEDLKKQGFQYTKTTGKYGGSSEPGYMVFMNGSLDQQHRMKQLGGKYKQNSVIISTPANKVIHFTHGKDKGTVKMAPENAFEYAHGDKDDYIEVKHQDGSKSRFKIDFGKDIQPSYALASGLEEQLESDDIPESLPETFKKLKIPERKGSITKNENYLINSQQPLSKAVGLKKGTTLNVKPSAIEYRSPIQSTANLVGFTAFGNADEKIQAYFNKLLQSYELILTDMGISFKHPVDFVCSEFKSIEETKGCQGWALNREYIAEKYSDNYNSRIGIEKHETTSKTLPHEIGHILDYALSDKDQARSKELEELKKTDPNNEVVKTMDTILNLVKSSDFYKVASTVKYAYYSKPTEQFARAMEVYFYAKAQQKVEKGELPTSVMSHFNPDIFTIHPKKLATLRIRELLESGAANKSEYHDLPGGKIWPDELVRREKEKKDHEELKDLERVVEKLPNTATIKKEQQDEYLKQIVDNVDKLLKIDKVKKALINIIL